MALDAVYCSPVPCWSIKACMHAMPWSWPRSSAGRHHPITGRSADCASLREHWLLVQPKYVTFNSQRDTIFSITCGNGISNGLDFFRCLAHSDTPASRLQHFQVVSIIADCHNLFH